MIWLVTDSFTEQPAGCPILKQVIIQNIDLSCSWLYVYHAPSLVKKNYQRKVKTGNGKVELRLN